MGCHVACPLDLAFADGKMSSPGQMLPFLFQLFIAQGGGKAATRVPSVEF